MRRWWVGAGACVGMTALVIACGGGSDCDSGSCAAQAAGMDGGGDGMVTPDANPMGCDTTMDQKESARLPERGDLKSLESDYKTATALRSVFIGAGAALVVGGTVLFLASSPRRKESPSRGMRFIPIATSKEAGFAWTGTF